MLPSATASPGVQRNPTQTVPQEAIPFLTWFAEAAFPPIQTSVLTNADEILPAPASKVRKNAPRSVVSTPVSALDIKSDCEFPPLGSATTTPVNKSFARNFSKTNIRESHLETTQIPGETQDLVLQHAAALLHVWQDAATPPATFFTAVTTLLTAARLSSGTEDERAFPFPPPGPSLKAYVRAVIHRLASTLKTFPRAFSTHLPSELRIEQKRQQLGDRATGTYLNTTESFHETQTFPSGAFIPRQAMTHGHGNRTETAAIEDVIDSVERSDDPHNDATPPVTRLRSNLEAAWDQFLILYRKYRGEISTAFKADLNQMDALRTMAALHPANVDLFAARTISLILRATRTPAHTPRRLRRLDERLSRSLFPSASPPMTSTVHIVAQNDTKRVAPRSKKTQFVPVQAAFATPTQNQSRAPLKDKHDAQSTVVLHRVPKAIRQAFATEHSDASFFLDFLTSVDSSRLAVALAPRLATAALHAVGVASRAKDNEGFTDAVLESRLLVRLLGVCMHLANWPYSEYALSGVEGSSTNADLSTGLSDRACMLRVPAADAVAVAMLDIHTLISEAAASGELLAIIAAVCTTDAALRSAAVDPVARRTEWFNRGLGTLAAVRVEDDAGTALPLIRAIVGACLQAQGVMPDDGISLAVGIPRVIYRPHTAEDVGDARFLRLICPAIDALRKELVMFFSNSSLRAPVVRRITPLARGFVDAKNASKVRVREGDFEGQKSKLNEVAVRKDSGWEGDANGEDDGDDLDSDNWEEAIRNIRNNDGDVEDDDAGEDDVRERLRKEFIARVDGRIRELVHIVAAAHSRENGDDVSETFVKAVQLLYPDTPHTVAAVAAGVCERRMKAIRRIRQGHGRGDCGKRLRRAASPVRALENALDGTDLAVNSPSAAINTTGMDESEQ